MSDNYEIKKSEMLPEYGVSVDGLNISQATLDKLGRDLKDRFDRLERLRQASNWERENAEAYEAYHMVPPNRELPYEGAPNLRCIFDRVAVDSLVANDKYALFGQDNFAKVEPDYVSKDFISVADKGSKFLTYQLRYEADFYSVVDDALRKARLFGIAYLEPRYEKQEVWETCRVETVEMVPEIDPLTQTMKLEEKKTVRTEKKKKTIFDGVRLDSIPVENILVSNFFRDLEEAVKHDVVIKKTTTTFKKLKDRSKETKGAKALYIANQVKQLESFVTNKVLNEMSDLQQAKKLLDGFELIERCEKEVIELGEAHLWEDVDGDGITEKITATFEPNTGLVVRVVLTPCRIVPLRPYPIDERFLGEKVHNIIKPVCEEWESIHNGRVVKNDWSNNTFFFFRAGGRFNPQEVQLRPGRGYPMDSPNDIYFPQITGPGPSGYQEEGLLNNYFERLLGLSENMQGVTSSRDVTATENINLSQKAGIRSSSPLGRIVTSLERVLEHIWALNAECSPKEKEYFVVGSSNGVPLFDKMTRSDFSVQLKFKFNIATIHDQQLLRDTWLMAFKMFRQDPLIMSHPAASYELFKNTLRGMGIQLDIPKPPQAEAISPSEEHEMIEKGLQIEPVPGEDYDYHLKMHKAWTETDKFKEWPAEKQMELMSHIDMTKILKQTIEAANLNKSGVFEGMPGGEAAQPQLPGMTLSRNPSQTFNNVRTGESGKSQQQNSRNGMGQ
jgi:hypothetical protein